MTGTALVTGADRGLGLALTDRLLQAGWSVVATRHLDWPELGALAHKYRDRLSVITMDVGSDRSVVEAAKLVGQQFDSLDLLISNAAINRSHSVDSVRHADQFQDMLDEFNINAIGGLRVVHSFLPLLDRGRLKRLCFVSSEAGSIGASYRTGWFGYCMSKAAINMAVKNMGNDLVRDGYSFRLYQPGYMRTYMQGVRNDAAQLEPDDAAKYALDYFLGDDFPAEPVLHTWDGEDMPW